MRHFFLDLPGGQDPHPGHIVELDAEESHHLRTVLRGGREIEIALVDGRGGRFLGMVLPGGKGAQRVEILAAGRDEAENAAPHLVLAVGVVKGKRFEWALEKATELGAHRIVPLDCRHGVIEPGEGRRLRWQGILRAALKQCGRAWLPELQDVQTVGRALSGCAGPVWFGATVEERSRRTGEPDPDRRVEPAAGPPAELAVFIGPEGGWAPEELELLDSHGALPQDLGPHVLRTETAAVAGLVLLQERRRAYAAG